MPALDQLAAKFDGVKKLNLETDPVATAAQSQSLADPPRNDATHHVALPIDVATDADPLRFSLLPPPAPCPVCGSPILWLDVYRRGWQCPGSSLEPATCSPPEIPALVRARVILVDVGTPDQPQPAWERLQTIERYDRRSNRRWREIATTPIATDLDDGEAKNSSQTTSQKETSNPHFFIDESLGKIFHYAEMDGQLGKNARPTGRVFYRDVDDWWGTAVGDPAKIEKEVASYEKFEKPNLGQKQKVS